MITRRNTRRRKARVSALPAPFAGVVALVSGAGLLYVWMCGHCDLLGQDIKNCEIELATQQEQYVAEEFKWARMKSPAGIEQALKRHNLTMSWPRPNQVVRLGASENVSHELAAGGGNGYRRLKLERLVLNE